MNILRTLCCLLLCMGGSFLYAADPVITSVTPETGPGPGFITNATTLTVSGTADVGASVVLLFDTVDPPVMQAANPAEVVGISGTFSFTLVTGITSYTTCYLAAKATTTSVAKTLVIDPVATAPVISAISPEIRRTTRRIRCERVDRIERPIICSAHGHAGTAIVRYSRHENPLHVEA